MPTVFISYSHDSETHVDQVRALSKHLRDKGIDCTIDQYADSPNEGWPQWMSEHIKDSEFVLLVCTETYQNRVEGREVDGIGLGVKWEALHILNDIYRKNSRNTKFIPVVFNPQDKNYIPDAVFGLSYFDLSQTIGLTNLIKKLWGELAIPKPPIGKKPSFTLPETQNFEIYNDTNKLLQIAKKLSRDSIYDLPKKVIEDIYCDLEYLNKDNNSGFANYLWVIIYHEYCKRHTPPQERSDLSTSRTLKAIKYTLKKDEAELIRKIRFYTDIHTKLNTFNGST